MWRARLSLRRLQRIPCAGPAAVLVLMGCLAIPSMALAQKVFSSPAQASGALFAAAQHNDEQAMLDILGPEARKLVSSGDATEDADNRANFVRRYQEMHRLVKEPDGTTALYVGARNWPMPIPLVGSGTAWHFDAAAATKEILYRRVGQNELSTIRVCQELAAAEKEYHALQGGHFADRFLSTAGSHDGLYWQTAAGQPQSPIGPLVAAAAAQGYVSQPGSPTPYHGYYYRILTGQGKNAPGGEKSYLVEGKMTGGFAFLAYPAQYRSSGVMSFLVGADGAVYEKDLGRKTAAIAKALQEFDPDASWRKSEDAQEQAAARQGK
jgi:Protein of unknown function (DUF2950)